MRIASWWLVLALVACRKDGDETDTDVDTDTDTDSDTDTDPDTDTDVEVERLDPTTIPQFAEPLVIPPALPPTSVDGDTTVYHVAVRQFEQQILPSSLPATTVWGFGRDGDPLPGEGASTYHAPGFTIEARRDEKIRVKWINGLVNDDGTFLPHLLPVDGTLHWANPGGTMPDMEGEEADYFGPVPFVVHLHGGHTRPESDGYPEAWFLPDATNLDGYHKFGSKYATVEPTDPGAAIFEYSNDQRAATLWVHDHVLGITRLNVYAGPASFWLIRDAEEDALGLPGPAPAVGDAAGTRYYEIPLAIQDRSFTTDGQLYYPSSRAEFDGYEGPYRPVTDIPPKWNPEHFGDTIIVNGRTWPYLEVEPRLYRFRVLNGSSSRFLEVGLDDPGLSFVQIGADQGLLPDPVERTKLLLGPAERADVLVDFSGLTPGDTVVMTNTGPDEPFKGFDDEEAPPPADPATTGKIMQFKVVALTGDGTPGAVPAALPPVEPLTSGLPERDLLLWEVMDMTADVPVEAKLGTIEHGPLDWEDPLTEMPELGTTEVWNLINLTGDAHPIHLHLVGFQVIDRTELDDEALIAAEEAWVAGTGPMPTLDAYLDGPAVPAPAEEAGWKDTVIAYPGEVTRVIATFDIEGLYVWHCHILEHEDNEMMRDFEVVAP
jgi:spore coat protein A